MLTRIMEERRLNPPLGMSYGYASRLGMVALAVAVVAAAVPMAVGQDNTGGKEFRASVVDLTGRRESVTVPLYRSITVKTSIETARADVVSMQIADVQVISPTEILITGENFGDTTVIFVGKNGQQYVMDVHVELDLAQLSETLKRIDPLSNVHATSIRGNIILTGTVSSADRARRMEAVAALYLPPPIPERAPTIVQNHLDVAGEQQVLLKCIVAEVSRRAARELGVNGFLAGENFRDAFVVNQLGGINPINIGAAASALVTEDFPFLTGERGLALTSTPTLSLGFPRVQMQLFIKAMAENSLLHILAEPNLVAISGETATFLAGGEFPIPVPQGNQQVTIEFREFGVRLNFTPVVRGQQRIRLRVVPEISELDFSTAIQIEGFVVPGLTKRSVETTVEIGSGQTIAIAGLLNDQARGLATRIPGIGDLPILGALFRSMDFRRSFTELVILVTPEIIAPLEPHQAIPLPTDGRIDPGDFELYALGMLDGGEKNVFGPGWSGRDRQSDKVRIASDPNELSLHGPWGSATALDRR